MPYLYGGSNMGNTRFMGLQISEYKPPAILEVITSWLIYKMQRNGAIARICSQHRVVGVGTCNLNNGHHGRQILFLWCLLKDRVYRQQPLN